MARIDPNNIEKWENTETPVKIKLKPRPKIKEVNDKKKDTWIGVNKKQRW
jgi:hypothetical protein